MTCHMCVSPWEVWQSILNGYIRVNECDRETEAILRGEALHLMERYNIS